MRSPKRALLLVKILALLMFSVPLVGYAGNLPNSSLTPMQLQRDLHVNPIHNLSSDFIMGADVSMLKQIEDSGGKFYDNGEEKDCLTILKEHGVNWIRLRIWNDPVDASGTSLGGGNNNLANTVAMAVRAKKMGLKLLLDFHYSDWWADPGKQTMPKAWVGLNEKDLEKAVYEYTAHVIQTLLKAGAMPDMVQVGNEVNGGMMWPVGKTWKEGTEEIGGYDGFAALLKMGVQAVRDNDPNNNDLQKRTKIVIHLANGGDNKLYHTVFDALTERHVDYDVIGLSYYSYWHGSLDDLKSNLNDISERYHKDVVIAETAYAATLNDKDGFTNLFSEREQNLGGYKATVLGQATAMRDLMEAVAQVPNGRGLGIFYWEPDWIAVDGAGWKSGEGDAWENQALFSFKGEALPSMNVFNLVKPASSSVYVPATLSGTYPTKLDMTLGETPTLPAEVQAAYSDDSIRNVPVSWESPDPAALAKGGEVTVKGTVNGTDLKAVLNITVSDQKNYVVNAGFENGNLDAWTVEGDSDAVDISKEASNIHAGTYALHYWKADAFAFTLSQTITDLPDGTYSLSAWMHGGGGEKMVQLYASDCGAEPLMVDTTNTGWLVWKTPTIANITISGGKCTIGLKVTATAGNWAFLDDVSLVKVD
ncbi:MAG: glycosyl hydrolase 53 family protein [Anaerolineae bacterium]|nr:glycosyl hydrolase 53 family protein [Anaerolineae bacterium]